MATPIPVPFQKGRPDPVALQDALAARTEWTPLVRGGANAALDELQAMPTGFVVRPTATGTAFTAAFLLFGGGFAFACIATLADGALGRAFLSLVLAAGALAVGVHRLRTARLRIDLHTGIYCLGRAQPAGAACPRTRQGTIGDIRALQILPEHVRGSYGHRRSYTSWELNLVLSDGLRINVLDHVHEPAILDAAQRLGEALGVPIWHVTRLPAA